MNVNELPPVPRPELDIVNEKVAVGDRMHLLVRMSGVGCIGVREEYREEYGKLRERHEALGRELFAAYEKPRLDAKEKADRERNEATYEREAVRVAGLPVKERKNGWEIVNDGGRYHVRFPHNGESVYDGKLSRCREVAAESPPDLANATRPVPPKPVEE